MGWGLGFRVQGLGFRGFGISLRATELRRGWHGLRASASLGSGTRELDVRPSKSMLRRPKHYALFWLDRCHLHLLGRKLTAGAEN